MINEKEALCKRRIEELENGLEFAIKIGLYLANNPKLDQATKQQGIDHLLDLKERILSPF